MNSNKEFDWKPERFRRKCTTLTVASFFSSVQRDRSTFLFNIINVDYGRPKHNRNARTSSKTKTSTSRTSKTPFGVFQSDFFRHYATFFEFHQRVSPSFASIFCNTMDIKKSQRAPFYIFRHCDAVQKSHFQIFFRKFLNISQGPPFNFFSNFATNWSFTKPKGSPFYNFEPSKI